MHIQNISTIFLYFDRKNEFLLSRSKCHVSVVILTCVTKTKTNIISSQLVIEST